MGVFEHFNYWVAVFLMMTGFYTVIARTNMVKKLIGLGMFQTAVFLLYISMGKIRGATAPYLVDGVPFSENTHRQRILSETVMALSFKVV